MKKRRVRNQELDLPLIDSIASTKEELGVDLVLDFDEPSSNWLKQRRGRATGDRNTSRRPPGSPPIKFRPGML